MEYLNLDTFKQKVFPEIDMLKIDVNESNKCQDQIPNIEYKIHHWLLKIFVIKQVVNAHLLNTMNL